MLTIVPVHASNPGPLTGAGNNTYLLLAETGDAALIDAGVGERRHLDELEQTLAAHRARLAVVLVTHAHGDHASGAPAVAAAHIGVRFYKYPWAEMDARYPVGWRALADGDSVSIGTDRLTAFHTPGHSPDHLAFWHEPTRTIFTGDLVIPGASVALYASYGGNLQQYLESLERLRDLQPARLLPAHGSESLEPVQVLTAHLEHRRLRERQVIQSLAAGRDTVESIAESIYDGLGSSLREAARENVRAHLDKLRAEGRAVEQDARWRLEWKQ